MLRPECFPFGPTSTHKKASAANLRQSLQLCSDVTRHCCSARFSLLQRRQHVVRPLFSAHPATPRVSDGELRPQLLRPRSWRAEDHLLRGVATEMRVSCCLCSSRTPVLPRIGFGADLTRRKRSACRSNTLPRQLTRLLRAARKLLFGFTWSLQRPRPSCRSAPKRIEPFGRTRTGALAHDIGLSRKLPLKSPDACHIASLGFLFANYRPTQRAGGLARGAPGAGRGALVVRGACGRGGGEVQVAAALALVSAYFSI